MAIASGTKLLTTPLSRSKKKAQSRKVIKTLRDFYFKV